MKQLILILSLAFVVCAQKLSEAAQISPATPNFLLILTDDLRADAVGYSGNPRAKTPNLDALANRGVRFANSFVTTSICSPGRAAILTGRYGSTTGVQVLDQAIKPNQPTWSQALQKAGYQTAHVGKWHLKNTPQELGFDRTSYFKSNGTYRDRGVFQNGKPQRAAGHIEDWCVDQSADFLKEAAKSGKPFALFHCTQLPHLNDKYRWDANPQTLQQFDAARFPLPRSWQDDLSNKPPYLKTSRSRTQAYKEYGYDKPENIQKHLRDYYAVVTDVDAALGRLLQTLDDLKLRDNTIIIFTSDNGWLMGEHGLTSKVLAYEESIRVPLVIAGPAIPPAAKNEMVLNIDLAPTLLELAGLKQPAPMHGRSLLPLLLPATASTEKQAPWRTSYRYEATKRALDSGPLEALRTADFKYIRTLKPDGSSETIFEELYDLARDPHEQSNLASSPDQQARLEAMRKELARLRDATAPGPESP